MIDQPRTVIDRNYWQWLLMTSAGYSAGCFLGFVCGHFLLGNAMIGIGIGVGVGLCQWLVLKKTGQVGPLWILANALGLAVAVGLHHAFCFLTGFPGDLGWSGGILGWAAALAAGGILTGYLQSHFFPHALRGTHWWLLACAAGWSLSAIGLGIPADMSGDYSGAWLPLMFLRNGMLAPAVAGLILAAVTGFGIRWESSTEESAAPALPSKPSNPSNMPAHG